MMKVKMNAMVDRRVYVDVLAMELKGSKCIPPAETIRAIVSPLDAKHMAFAVMSDPADLMETEAFGINQPLSRLRTTWTYIPTYVSNLTS
jgi:hypothetical protein